MAIPVRRRRGAHRHAGNQKLAITSPSRRVQWCADKGSSMLLEVVPKIWAGASQWILRRGTPEPQSAAGGYCTSRERVKRRLVSIREPGPDATPECPTDIHSTEYRRRTGHASGWQLASRATFFFFKPRHGPRCSITPTTSAQSSLAVSSYFFSIPSLDSTRIRPLRSAKHHIALLEGRCPTPTTSSPPRHL
jgi:hypothetical protein